MSGRQRSRAVPRLRTPGPVSPAVSLFRDGELD